MEKESFLNLELASYINTAFVSLKVDREMRPDLDSFFTLALASVKGSAGWPITAVLTPDGKPLWLESYLNKAQLLTSLQHLNTAWQKNPKRLKQVSRNLAAQLQIPDETTAWRHEFLNVRLENIISKLDPEHGGLQGSPKFPNAALLQLLLYQYQRQPSIMLKQQLKLVLDNLISKGLRDQVNGGFYRYSTDAAWLLPHFEKMLYNQALLISVFIPKELKR